MVLYCVEDHAGRPWYNPVSSGFSHVRRRQFLPRTLAADADDPCRSKVVAHGAVCFYLEHFVSARVMKMTYGAEVLVEYNAHDPEHYSRRSKRLLRPSGDVGLRHGFSLILQKVYLVTILRLNTCTEFLRHYVPRDRVCGRTRRSLGRTVSSPVTREPYTASSVMFSVTEVNPQTLSGSMWNQASEFW